MRVAERVVGEQHIAEVGLKSRLHLGVLCRGLGIGTGCIEVVEAAVAAGSVGDVPEGIGASTVLQGSAAHGIGVAAHVGSAVATLRGVLVEVLPLSILKVGRIESVGHIAILLLLGPLGDDVLVGDGIEQSGAVDADGRLQLHPILLRIDERTHLVTALIVGIDGRLGHGHLGVLQFVGLSVGELVAPQVGMLLPLHDDLTLVDRRLEGCHGMALRHTCQPAHVALIGLVVHYQEASVAYLVGVEGSRLDALAMAISGVAVHTRGAYIGGSEARAQSAVLGVEGVLKQCLAILEGRVHAGIVYRLRGLLKGIVGSQGRSAQLSASIVPVGKFGGCGATLLIATSDILILLAGRERCT